MYQVTVDVPKIMEHTFINNKLSVYEVVQQYIERNYENDNKYSIYTDDILNPLTFVGTMDECITDLHAMIKTG